MSIKCLVATVFLCLFLFELNVYSQGEFKNWNAISFSIPTAGKLNFNLGQQSGFSFKPYDLDWMQLSISGIYKVNRKSSFSLGYRNSIIFRSKENKHKHRIVGVYSLKSALNNFRISNSIITEYHSKTETKYRWRIIYAFRIKTRKKIELPTVDIRPYFSSLFYFNIGGNTIDQFNNSDEFVGEFVPYGWHRMRFSLGLNFSFSNQWGMAVYVMNQREFNTDFATWNAMNVYNPERDKIIRPFNNYSVIGWSLRHYLKRNKRKKKKRSEGSNEWKYFSSQDDF